MQFVTHGHVVNLLVPSVQEQLSATPEPIAWRMEFRGDSTQLRSAYDFVKSLRLRHDDIGYEQFQ